MSLIGDLFDAARENAERKKRANSYLRSAKTVIQSANDDYYRVYNKVNSLASETEYKLRRHSEYKQQIARELGGTIGSTLKDFSSFNIEAKTFSAPSIPSSNAGLPAFESAMSKVVSDKTSSSILDMFISDEDYFDAQCKYDEAKRYKERMKSERNRLNRYKEKIREISSFIDSEKRELDSLVGKLKKMTDELRTGMQKSSFSAEEAEYLKGIHKIAECVVKLLSTEFLGDTFSINSQYWELFSEIKEINENLPYSPSISDAATRSAMKRALDGMIVH